MQLLQGRMAKYGDWLAKQRDGLTDNQTESGLRGTIQLPRRTKEHIYDWRLSAWVMAVVGSPAVMATMTEISLTMAR